MRLPTRLHITWQDDTTMKVEADAGTQTRLFHFGDWKAPAGEPTLQGDTTAQWETRAPPRRHRRRPRFGNLKTVTTSLKPGYLRKNGVPYSDKTTLTEILGPAATAERRAVDRDHDVVEDPTYLRDLDHVAQLQEGTERLEVGSDPAVRRLE